MLKLIRIAVTGGLSCGKSTVCQLFKELGASIISADEIVHHLLSLNTEVGKDIVNWLGPQATKNGVIDKKYIAETVFDNPEKLKILEQILHPKVREEIKKAYNVTRTNLCSEIFVAEIPLLFESSSFEDSLKDDFDYVITVSALPENAKNRFKLGSEEWTKRSSLQMPLSEKEKKSDFIIYNNGSYEELKLQVQKLNNHIKNHESRRHAARNE